MNNLIIKYKNSTPLITNPCCTGSFPTKTLICAAFSSLAFTQKFPLSRTLYTSCRVVVVNSRYGYEKYNKPLFC